MTDLIMDQLNEKLKEAAKYANDPATDRTFLAQRYLEAMLVRNMPGNPKYYVQIAFELADEFIEKAKK